MVVCFKNLVWVSVILFGILITLASGYRKPPALVKPLLCPPAAPQQDPEYMEQPSPTNDSKHLQEDTERAISRAAAEQEERGPEALLNAVCNPPSYPSLIITHFTPHAHCLSSVQIYTNTTQ